MQYTLTFYLHRLLSRSFTVRGLGVILDSTLTLKPQIAAISWACLFHHRRIQQLRSTIDSTSLKTPIYCLILIRLNYCDSVLYGLPESMLLSLTRILHQAARLCLRLSYFDHVTPALCALKSKLTSSALPMGSNFRSSLTLSIQISHVRVSWSLLVG